MLADENALERSLRLAADDPASRPDFYKLLLASTIVVIGNSGQRRPGLVTIAAGDDVAIASWTKDDDTSFVPFFTSLTALQRVLTEETNYLSLPARDFFELTKGATLHLNPSLDHSKEFFPSEVIAILSGGVNQVPSQRVIQEETQVLLGQPKELPERMITALRSHFARRSQIQAAYVCLMHDPSIDEQPHLLVGILADGDFEIVSREAGSVINDTAPDVCDVMRIVVGDTGPSSYFLAECKPFYERSLGGKLRSLFGA
jgi:SseB protein C-terminal domain/SseB protein N-terminal domain